MPTINRHRDDLRVRHDHRVSEAGRDGPAPPMGMRKGHGGLAQELAAIARELVDVATVEETLRRIVELAVETVPGCDHAGLSLVTAGRIDTHTQSDAPVPQMIGEIHNDTGEGPAMDAIRHQQVCETTDLTHEPRWPRFSPAVVEQTDVRAILATRLFITEETAMGSINFYAEREDAFNDTDRSVTSIFAIHAAVALRAAQQHEQLIAAIESRDVIGQAKGIIMVRMQVDDATAFAILRDGSRRRSRKLRGVAQQIVDHECKT